MSFQFAYHELPADNYPITLRAYRTDTGEKVWEETLESPGPVVVPALREQLGVDITIEVTLGTGEVIKRGTDSPREDARDRQDSTRVGGKWTRLE